MDGYGKRVLVVEDDDDVRTLFGVILRETGYNVYEACDGLEAIDALKKRRYDVLLTDYHMPKMDGLELLDHTRRTWNRGGRNGLRISLPHRRLPRIGC